MGTVVDSPSKRGAMLAYLWADPVAWVQLCRVASKGDSAYPLAWFHKDWIKLLRDNPQEPVLFEAPRGFLKSTVIDDYILGDILYSPDAPQHQALLICDNETRCREAANEYEMILSSEMMQNLFGGIEYHRLGDDIYLDKVGARLRGRRVEQNIRPSLSGATIGCYTVETSRVGMHIDHGYAHFDDAYVSATACSAVQQETRRQRINVGWYPMFGTHTKKVVSGTRHTLIDEYGVMEARGVPTNLTSRSAELPDGRLLWPGEWPKAALDARRKEIGEVAYRLQYLNDVSALAGAIFPEELVRLAWTDELPAELSHTRLVGLDMAYGGSDYTAMVKGARYGSRIYIMDSMMKKYNEMTAKYQAIKTFSNGALVVTETNGPQKENVPILKTHGVQAVGYNPSHKSKLERARETIRPLLEQGLLRITDRVILNELIQYSGDETRPDDIIDALVMAIYGCKRFLAGETKSAAGGLTRVIPVVSRHSTGYTPPPGPTRHRDHKLPPRVPKFA